MRKITVIIALFLAAIQIVSAQKVGLVLSGGGAKGAAHIGVIKALEENNIPIDYITGTSIGAIIGSLYAMGYSPRGDAGADAFQGVRLLANRYGGGTIYLLFQGALPDPGIRAFLHRYVRFPTDQG